MKARSFKRVQPRILIRIEFGLKARSQELFTKELFFLAASQLLNAPHRSSCDCSKFKRYKNLDQELYKRLSQAVCSLQSMSKAQDVKFILVAVREVNKKESPIETEYVSCCEERRLIASWWNGQWNAIQSYA